MDALVALRDHRAHAEQVRPLRRPVARRARSVLLAGEHDERDAFGAVALGGVEDRHLLARRDVHRPRSLGPGHELVAEADVRERAAHHHLVVAAPRAVRVEVLALDAVLDEVAAGRRVRLDRAGGRDVVRRHRVADRDEAARADDVLDGVRLGRHAVEVRREPDVRRVWIPGEELALGHRQRAPRLVAREHVRVRRAEHLLADRAGDRLAHLVRRRPDVGEEDVLAVRARRRSARSRGRCPCARRARTRRRAAVRRGSSPSPRGGSAPRSSGSPRARRRRRGRPRRRRRDLVGQRARVPDARRAAVADGVEAELLEVRREPGAVVVLGDDLRAGREARLHPRLAREAALDAPSSRAARRRPSRPGSTCSCTT